MKIFNSLSEIPADFGPSIATIGNFDGVHRGHHGVIAEVVARARALAPRDRRDSMLVSVRYRLQYLRSLIIYL